MIFPIFPFFPFFLIFILISLLILIEYELAHNFWSTIYISHIF